ncbi:MAG: transglutaminase family protein [Candidatus Dadabacteria bacterium]|nr:transglutaminase family protein [Candidatus Dadabacteria bacterium]
MLYKIEHVTQYSFSKEVFLEPHTIRLRPRSDSAQTVQKFEIDVNPEPKGRTNLVDIGGDSMSLWFEELTDSLTIISRSEVETHRSNPFDFLLSSDRVHLLPMEYSGPDESVLEPYRMPSSDFGDKFEGFVAKILLESENSTLNFLSVLTSYINQNLEHEVREEGLSHEPGETLSQMKGSCRDFVVLFAEVCRSMGIASRFVSGYTVGDPENSENYLHAWAEVYLPGGGWRGYDPTLGLAVADRHVALTSGATPMQAAPVTGSFRGTGAEAKMEYQITITV